MKIVNLFLFVSIVTDVLQKKFFLIEMKNIEKIVEQQMLLFPYLGKTSFEINITTG